MHGRDRAICAEAYVYVVLLASDPDNHNHVTPDELNECSCPNDEGTLTRQAFLD